MKIRTCITVEISVLLAGYTSPLLPVKISKHHTCYHARPEPEYYSCYPVIGLAKFSRSDYENLRQYEVGKICSANPTNLPSQGHIKVFVKWILSSLHLMYFQGERPAHLLHVVVWNKTEWTLSLLMLVRRSWTENPATL
jgi:hypothetical protein